MVVALNLIKIATKRLYLCGLGAVAFIVIKPEDML